MGQIQVCLNPVQGATCYNIYVGTTNVRPTQAQVACSTELKHCITVPDCVTSYIWVSSVINGQENISEMRPFTNTDNCGSGALTSSNQTSSSARLNYNIDNFDSAATYQIRHTQESAQSQFIANYPVPNAQGFVEVDNLNPSTNFYRFTLQKIVSGLVTELDVVEFFTPAQDCSSSVAINSESTDSITVGYTFAEINSNNNHRILLHEITGQGGSIVAAKSNLTPANPTGTHTFNNLKANTWYRVSATCTQNGNENIIDIEETQTDANATPFLAQIIPNPNANICDDGCFALQLSLNKVPTATPTASMLNLTNATFQSGFVAINNPSSAAGYSFSVCIDADGAFSIGLPANALTAADNTQQQASNSVTGNVTDLNGGGGTQNNNVDSDIVAGTGYADFSWGSDFYDDTQTDLLLNSEAFGASQGNALDFPTINIPSTQTSIVSATITIDVDAGKTTAGAKILTTYGYLPTPHPAAASSAAAQATRPIPASNLTSATAVDNFNNPSTIVIDVKDIVTELVAAAGGSWNDNMLFYTRGDAADTGVLWGQDVLQGGNITLDVVYQTGTASNCTESISSNLSLTAPTVAAQADNTNNEIDVTVS